MSPRPLIERSSDEAIHRDHLATVHAQLCLERGFASVTVTDLVARAEVSWAAFHQLFARREDCFVFLIASAADELAEVVDDSAAPGLGFDEEVLRATRAALTWLAANPARASALLIDAHAGPSEARRLQIDLFDRLVDRLARARRGGSSSGALEQMLLGGTVTVLRRLAVDGELASAPEHAVDLGHLMARLPVFSHRQSR